ncbi:hypothetical protein NBRC116587_07890 [Pseudoteredinibacter isoporae]
MIDRDHKLSISRGSVYYQPQPVSPDTMALMNRIDRLHLDYPFAGSRMLRDLLRRESYQVGRKQVTSLMRQMGIEALYRKPMQRHPGHKVYPYLLPQLAITRPNQFWAMDITYIPMARGFVYLAAVVDWHTRRVLSWKLSTTMELHFCVDAMEEALARYGAPEIMNTDQGSQFTSLAFTQMLKDKNILISMGGKGCWRDNVFVERLWRSVKYEEVYLHAYDTVSAARSGLDRNFQFYNGHPRALTGKPRMGFISIYHRCPWWLNQGQRSTYRMGMSCSKERGQLSFQFVFIT